MNRWWKTGMVLLLGAVLAGCGNNSTTAGITITAASTTTGANSVTVPINGTEQFGATVTGVSDTTVQWQVCLPTTSTTVLPTTCTTIPGVTPPHGFTVLTGYGSINQNGFYTAPSQIPTRNNFVILATSPVDTTTFATFGVVIDSGIRIQVTPATATIGAGETVQFTATVTGTTNTAVTWEVNGLAGGDANNGGTISASGLFTAQANGTGTVTIKAVSGADGTTNGTATVSVVNAAPTLSSIEPHLTEQGAAQQEVYLSGSNFTSNGSVLVNNTALPFVFISSSLLRVPIPSSMLTSTGTLSIAFQLQPIPPALGEVSNSATLDVVPVRPAIVAASPQSFTSTNSSTTVNLTGGFFSQGTPATTVQFDNGNEGSVAASFLSSRQISVALPATGLSVPGLYPLTVQNPGAASLGQPSLSTINIAVTPASIPPAPGPNATISLGGSTQPTAIAMDLADGIAVVTEEDQNAVALINVSNGTVIKTISVGAQPTSVAVDDLLPHPLAVVVNSGDDTLSVIDLTTESVSTGNQSAISLAAFTPTISKPVAIGINPETHRAIVANSSTNLGTIVDLSPAGCTGVPCAVAPLMVVGGSLTSYGTGGSPNIAIDPSLNWAIVTPGGAGSISIVDLGFGSPNAGSGGRAPAVIAALSISTTIQGVGIDPETHQALFTDYNSGNVTTFSLLDNTVTSVTNNGTPLIFQGELAAAVNPLENIGIAVNAQGFGTASIVDMGNHVVLQTVTGLTTSQGGGSPQAVAVDPATNEALIVNEGLLTGGTRGPGSISIVSLAGSSPVKPLQILESSPAMSFANGNPLSLTVTGTGFTASSTVALDNTPLPSGSVTVANSRTILATIPASLLGSARHFAVQVQNTDGTVSNAAPLTVVQAVTVGTAPAGVAVDSDRDVALVANSGSNNMSLVSIAPPSISPQSLGPVGVINTPLPLNAHLDPRAVAVDPLAGVGVVANYDSNDLSVIDYSELFQLPYSLPAVPGCSTASVCTGPAGIAFNQDTSGFLVTDSNVGTPTSGVAAGSISAPTATSAVNINSPAVSQAVDQTPGDLAIAPSFDPFDPVNNPNPSLTYAAIASAAQTSVIDFFDTSTQLVVGRTTGVSEPTGVVYDSLNHVFLVSDSLNNNIVIVNPLTFVPVTVRGGFNPSSIAYNSQTSTIVAVNGTTGTLSVLDYLCPPLTVTPACTSPQIRATLGLVGSQISSTAPLGPKTVDIDPLLNLAVLVDSENNRVLLIPLPY
jgi:DNA-binding beta-propeller fold protein YncE